MVLTGLFALSLVYWDVVVCPKEIEGLGFCDFYLRNEVLLVREVSCRNDSLWGKFIMSKYSLQETR